MIEFVNMSILFFFDNSFIKSYIDWMSLLANRLKGPDRLFEELINFRSIRVTNITEIIIMIINMIISFMILNDFWLFEILNFIFQ